MRRWLIGPVLALSLLAGVQAVEGADKKPAQFGALEALSPETARAKAEAWLKEAGKTDAATQQKFAAIWNQQERNVLDRLADTFALGNAQAAKLLETARDPGASAPTRVPDVFKDAAEPLFFRANLALAYTRAMSHRKVYEESLEVLKLFHPEQVCDPASYLFHRAVAEHSLLQRDEAIKSLHRLLDDAISFTPERYKAVASLMLIDMAGWKDKDLSTVARKMDNVARRLDLSRGGPETQRQQKEIVARLDEIIKELENKKKGGA